METISIVPTSAKKILYYVNAPKSTCLLDSLVPTTWSHCHC